MPKTKISEYSSTASNNTDINSINIGEGMAPSDVNNAIRELMAQIKNLQAGTSGDTIPIAAGGTGATTASAARTALGAGTGDVTTTGTQTLTNKTLTGAKVTVSALGTLTTGTTTIDLSTAQVYTATITAANTITFAFSNAPGAGTSQVVLLRLTDAGGGTIVYPANTKFAAGTAPTLTASGVDVLGVYYDVTTTTYMVFVIGLDVKVPA